MAMIIDPPSRFAPLSEWTRFRKDMEALFLEFPEDEDVRDHLSGAKAIEADLLGRGEET